MKNPNWEAEQAKCKYILKELERLQRLVDEIKTEYKDVGVYGDDIDDHYNYYDMKEWIIPYIYKA